MSDVELTHMTSKGQVVIPSDIRAEVSAGQGTVFAVFGSGDTILLKKINKPTKEEIKKGWTKLVKESGKKARALGIKERDVPRIIEKGRALKTRK
jgi:bifunctional DNA-binding transcriptional regulator/antitoxin component of YhaV-PrlF toxin-antitoxin module